VVVTGTPDELKARAGSQVLRVAPADPARMAEVTALMSGLIRTEAAIDADDRAATAPVGGRGRVRGRGRGRELGPGDVGKRLAPPGEQRVPQDPRGPGGVAGGQRVTALPGQRAGRDDTPGVQGQQRPQNPQLTAASLGRTPVSSRTCGGPRSPVRSALGICPR
jgi:hypothetical protein